MVRQWYVYHYSKPVTWISRIWNPEKHFAFFLGWFCAFTVCAWSFSKEVSNESDIYVLHKDICHICIYAYNNFLSFVNMLAWKIHLTGENLWPKHLQHIIFCEYIYPDKIASVCHKNSNSVIIWFYSPTRQLNKAVLIDETWKSISRRIQPPPSQLTRCPEPTDIVVNCKIEGVDRFICLYSIIWIFWVGCFFCPPVSYSTWQGEA